MLIHSIPALMTSKLSLPIRYFICFFIVTSFSSCKKDSSVPEINTAVISDIKTSTAVSGGTVINNGGDPVLNRGVCWSTKATPTIECEKTIQEGNIGWFLSKIISLSPNTKYFVRAYATNNAGTGYGNELTFTTNPISVPTLTTSANTLSDGSPMFTGEVTDDGGSQVTDRRLCWCSSLETPTVNNIHTHNGNGTGIFTHNTSKLSLDSSYHVRSYATNATGTGYGNAVLWSLSGGCKK